MLKSAPRSPRLNREAAETIAAQGLAFLSAEPALLARFLALTGLQPADLKARLGSGELLAAVLDFLAGDESLLLAFAANHNVAPETISLALSVLEASDAP